MLFTNVKGSYLGGIIPEDYRCSCCDVLGAKLWREYGISFESPKLFCVMCAEWQAGTVCDTDIRCFTGDGEDQIGILIPAIPMEGSENCYWGYNYVPEGAQKWWGDLPAFVSWS
ncbi:MAG: hypothetical protein WCG84_01605 [Candidatus Moraniibacteriota bacterium]